MRPYRTVLEQKIKERHQTFEEFAESVETFAREHGEKGTLSVRHLHRLAAGRRADGRPLGPVQPATARLLEQMLGVEIDELLGSPTLRQGADPSVEELRQRLHASSQVDGDLIATLQDQLSGLRRLDRQLGAPVAHQEVRVKVTQVTDLLRYSVVTGVREKLAALLSEIGCLAGWQALDLGRTTESWRLYSDAVSAAKVSNIPSYIALATAGQAFVLADIGKAADAVEMMAEARRGADQACSRLLRSWLAAAHGEVPAGRGQHENSLRAFDTADVLLTGAVTSGDPYVALDHVHLARWRGCALTKCAQPEAVNVLTSALARLDPTFVRAEAGLRADLALAFASIGYPAEAREHAISAARLADQIGSARQKRRMAALLSSLRIT